VLLIAYMCPCSLEINIRPATVASTGASGAVRGAVWGCGWQKGRMLQAIKESPTNTPDIIATLKSSRGTDGNAGEHATIRRLMKSRYSG